MLIQLKEQKKFWKRWDQTINIMPVRREVYLGEKTQTNRYVVCHIQATIQDGACKCINTITEIITFVNYYV